MSSPFIHPLADVKTHSIGAGTRVWQFAVVCEGATIGRNCNICSHTFIEGGASVGNGTTVKCGVQLWRGVTIGSNVFIGPNATFCNDKHPVSGNRDFTLLETIVEDNVSIGANATILPGITLARGCIIGAGAVVTHSTLPGKTYIGNPASASN